MAVVFAACAPLVLAAFLGGALAGGVVASFPQLPQLEGSQEFKRFQGLVLARDGTTVLRRLRQPTSRRYLQDKDLPDVLADAVVSIEDRRFFTHHGIDPQGVARAALTDLRAGSVEQGGSTITQQLVKNAYVGKQQTLARKSREATLALALETRWSKRRILTAYLNTAYYGNGAYGVRDAARTYFGKEPRTLGVAEAALLAGLLRAPSGDDPFAAPNRALARREQVLTAMVAAGRLSAAQAAKAAAVPLPTPRRSGGGPRSELAPHFVDDVVADLVRSRGTARALGGGLRVRTTLDARMQRSAVRAVSVIEGVGLSSALVSLDVRTGEVRALAVGGKARRGDFNVASAGQRQPGSAFKPFALAAAFEKGFTPSSRFRSAPFDDEVDGTRFEVTNSSGSYVGLVTLEQATWDSDNTVYARLEQRLGVRAVVGAARSAGVVSEIDEVPAAVLGGLPRGVTPLELARAYLTFARRGTRIGDERSRPVAVSQLTDPRSGTSRPSRAISERVFSQQTADLVTRTLTGVVARGTGTRAAIGRPAAGKTGTTENYADAWFAGFTPDLVTVVWVGDSRGSVPMRTQYLGGPVTGGTWPARIWSSFMRDAPERNGKSARRFAADGLRFVAATIDPKSRLLAGFWCTGAVTERFVRGSQPTEEASECQERARPAPRVTGRSAAEARALLEREGFLAEVSEAPGTAAQQGRVIRQVPAAGAFVRRAQPITLVVAAGLAADEPAAEPGNEPGVADGDDTEVQAPEPVPAPQTDPVP